MVTRGSLLGRFTTIQTKLKENFPDVVNATKHTRVDKDRKTAARACLNQLLAQYADAEPGDPAWKAAQDALNAISLGKFGKKSNKKLQELTDNIITWHAFVAYLRANPNDPAVVLWITKTAAAVRSVVQRHWGPQIADEATQHAIERFWEAYTYEQEPFTWILRRALNYAAGFHRDDELPDQQAARVMGVADRATLRDLIRRIRKAIPLILKGFKGAHCPAQVILLDLLAAWPQSSASQLQERIKKNCGRDESEDNINQLRRRLRKRIQDIFGDDMDGLYGDDQ